jgi:hypothetical protein
VVGNLHLRVLWLQDSELRTRVLPCKTILAKTVAAFVMWRWHRRGVSVFGNAQLIGCLRTTTLYADDGWCLAVACGVSLNL